MSKKQEARWLASVYWEHHAITAYKENERLLERLSDVADPMEKLTIRASADRAWKRYRLCFARALILDGKVSRGC